MHNIVRYFQTHLTAIAAFTDHTDTASIVPYLPRVTVTPYGKFGKGLAPNFHYSLLSNLPLNFLHHGEYHRRNPFSMHRRASSICHVSLIRCFHYWNACLMNTSILRYREHFLTLMAKYRKCRNWEKKKRLHFSLNWCYGSILLFIIFHTVLLFFSNVETPHWAISVYWQNIHNINMYYINN